MMTRALPGLLAFALTAVAALSAGAQTPTPPPTTTPTPTPPTAPTPLPRELPLTVATIAGRVEVRGEAGTWELPKLRDEVAPGRAARALTGGRITLRTKGGHAVRLGQLSQLTLPEAQEGGADAPIQVRLDGGHLWVAVGPGSVSAPAFEIKAGTASVSAYSGGAGLVLGGDGNTLIRVYHGRVVCKGGGTGGAWERTVKANEELLIPTDRAPAPPRSLTRDKSDDAWVLWNREQDRAGGYGGPRPR